MPLSPFVYSRAQRNEVREVQHLSVTEIVEVLLLRVEKSDGIELVPVGILEQLFSVVRDELDGGITHENK